MLEIRDLAVEYPTEYGQLEAVHDFDLAIGESETYGLVGESGAGKSTVARAILGMIGSQGSVRGQIRYRGQNLPDLSTSQMQNIRGTEISMIFQDPSEALNPVLTVGQQLRRVVKNNRDDSLSTDEIDREIIKMLERVQIPDPKERLSAYPVEFSGGMSQRVMIAMVLLCKPDLIMADEPTTKLDVTVEAHILQLLEDICENEGISVVYITHNMGIVANHCDRVGVMYAGKKVEEGSVANVFRNPSHPYTRDLLTCIPRPDVEDVNRLETIDGTMPMPVDLPDVCYYADRCSMARDECRKQNPPLELVEGLDDHESACLYAEEVHE